MALEKEEKTPFWANCQSCGHEWIVLYTPMTIEKFAKLAHAQMCPKCHEEKKIYCGRSENSKKLVSIVDPLSGTPDGLAS